MLTQSIPLIRTGGSPIGWIERERWVHAHDVLLKAGAVEKFADIDGAFTMQFLTEIAGQAE